MFEQIESRDLTLDDVPTGDAEWYRITEFALTFDGYGQGGSFDECAEVGNRWAEEFADNGTLPDSLKLLRTCLFFEQRRHHHFGRPPSEQAMRYIRALIEEIRGKLQAGETD